MRICGRTLKAWVWGLFLALLVLGLTMSAAAYQAEDVKNGGTITGKILFKGTPPPREMLKASKDTEVCGKEVPSEALVVGENRGIQWAIVSLVDIKKGKGVDKKATVELDQKGCHYAPHIVKVPAGGTLAVLNSDGILHNIHTYSKVNKSVNKAQPKFRKKLLIDNTFKDPELVSVKCDAHAWMSGYILVEEHPYHAITTADGSFSLSEVPPGTYKVEVWHEKLGKVTKEVKVEAGKATTLDVELAAM